MPKDELALWVQAAQKGDQQAMAALIENSQNSLFKFCLFLCSRAELAEDLCQEAFLRAFLNINNLKNPQAFQGWLFQCARNAFLDFVKSPKNKGHDEISDLPHNDLNAEDYQTSFEVRKTLQALDPEERVLLVLIDIQGFSYAEAAKITGLSEPGMPSRLHRIRLNFMGKHEK